MMKEVGVACLFLLLVAGCSQAPEAALLDAARMVRTIAASGQSRRVKVSTKTQVAKSRLLYAPLDPIATLDSVQKVALLERIEQRLVIRAFLKMAHEPAETIGTGIFLPDKLTRDFHCPHSLSELLITGEAASSGQWTAGKISAVRTDCCIKAP